MQEQITRRGFGRGCLEIAAAVLLGGGVVIGLGTLKYLETQRLKRSFVEVEQEILDVFKKYATKTPKQIQSDSSFQDWEKYNLVWQGNNRIICSASYTEKEPRKGPHLEVSELDQNLPEIDFLYRCGNSTLMIDFEKSQSEDLLTLHKREEESKEVNTITYIFENNGQSRRRCFKLKNYKSYYLYNSVGKKEKQQILSLIETLRKNYTKQK